MSGMSGDVRDVRMGDNSRLATHALLRASQIVRTIVETVYKRYQRPPPSLDLLDRQRAQRRG